MANISRKAGTNSSKKASTTRMEFNEEQKDALSMFIAQEVRNKMVEDKLKQLTKAVEEITEEKGYRLKSRMESMLQSDTFLIEEPSVDEKLSLMNDEEIMQCQCEYNQCQIQTLITLMTLSSPSKRLEASHNARLRLEQSQSSY